MKKLTKLLLFINLQLFNIMWNPYNGGSSYLFRLQILGIGGIFNKNLFLFQVEHFYQWTKPQYRLDILFFTIIKNSREL